MKYLLEFLLGMLFLFSMIGFVSAQYDWTTFGSNSNSITNAQSVFGTGRLDLNIQSISSVYGISINNNNSGFQYQPLISNLGNPSKEYIIVPDGNNLDVIDGNMNLISSVSLSNPANSQIGAVDFDQDGNTNDIAVFINSSSTNFTFRVFKFNPINLSFITNPIYSQNFSFVSGTSLSGFHCVNNHCFTSISMPFGSVYNISILDFNESGSLQINLGTNMTNRTFEPPAYDDFDSDGINEYMIWSADKILIFDQTGTISTELNNTKIGSGVYSLGTIEAVKMMKSDNSNIWKIAVARRYTSLIAGCFDDIELFGMGLSSSGSILYQKNLDCASSSSDTIHSGGISIADYNSDGFDDIFTSSYRGNANNLTKFFVIQGNTGNFLSTSSAPSVMKNNQVNSMTIAKLNNNVFDFIVSSGNSFGIYDPSNSSYIYYTNLQPVFESCVPSDINLDGFQEVVCSGSSVSKYYYSGANLVCNNNTICEPQYAETSSTCPSDCPVINNTNQSGSTQTPDFVQTDNGGMPIPAQIVDVNDYNKGLLPEIYFGTLGFLSNTLSPIIIIVFAIFFVLIMIAIGVIIKNIAKKVGNLSG